jgi:hypothetical protein
VGRCDISLCCWPFFCQAFDSLLIVITLFFWQLSDEVGGILKRGCHLINSRKTKDMYYQQSGKLQQQ